MLQHYKIWTGVVKFYWSQLVLYRITESGLLYFEKLSIMFGLSKYGTYSEMETICIPQTTPPPQKKKKKRRRKNNNNNKERIKQKQQHNNSNNNNNQI